MHVRTIAEGSLRLSGQQPGNVLSVLERRATLVGGGGHTRRRVSLLLALAKRFIGGVSLPHPYSPQAMEQDRWRDVDEGALRLIQKNFVCLPLTD